MSRPSARSALTCQIRRVATQRSTYYPSSITGPLTISLPAACHHYQRSHLVPKTFTDTTCCRIILPAITSAKWRGGSPGAAVLRRWPGVRVGCDASWSSGQRSRLHVGMRDDYMVGEGRSALWRGAGAGSDAEQRTRWQRSASGSRSRCGSVCESACSGTSTFPSVTRLTCDRMYGRQPPKKTIAKITTSQKSGWIR